MEDTQRARWLWDEVRTVLEAELAREVGALCRGDLGTIEVGLQGLLRRVGGALLGGLIDQLPPTGSLVMAQTLRAPLS